MLEQFLALETQGWRALSSSADAGVEFYSQILRNDALMLFPGGMLVNGKEAILHSFGAQPWRSFQIEDARLLELTEASVALVYRVTAEREGQDPYIALVSSTYVRTGQNWKLAVHQQTPA
jgi:hypothetical protein